MQKRIGRPALSELSKLQIVHKLEPYLKSGFSVKKACLLSGVPSSTTYKYMHSDPDFVGVIEAFQQYASVIVAQLTMSELMRIARKQSDGNRLDAEDIKFLQWFALNSNLTRDEFRRPGEPAPSQIDPIYEFRRLVRYIDEHSN